MTQVFSDVESTTLKGSVCSLIVHVEVPVEEVHLNKLHYLNGDIKRHRHYHLRSVGEEKGKEWREREHKKLCRSAHGNIQNLLQKTIQ